MTDGIHPRGEDLRNAVRWLAEQEDHSLEVINAAAVRFDLSPLDTEFLVRMFASKGGNQASQDQKTE